nr:putative disease resistance protein RGA3 [Coffea arabica]
MTGMEAAILSAVVSPIARKVFDLVSSLLAGKFHLHQGVEEDIRDLSSQLTAILAVLEHAEELQLDSPPIRDWLGKLKEVLFDAEDILESFQTEALLWQRQQQARNVHLPFSASQLFMKLNVAQEIKKVLLRLEKIGRERQNFQLDAHAIDSGASSTRPSMSRNTGFIVAESDVVGRDDDKDRMINLLLSEESDRQGDVSVAPIIGMGGVGKTTLAQLVYNDERVKSHFEFRMWVCVTDVFNYTKVLKDMIEYHTEIKYNDISSLSNVQLESRLLELLKGKPYLLILDDVWPESFDWSDLQKLLKHGGKGSRVVVTSRSSHVANLMGTLPPHFLELLPEDQCQFLFEKIAFGPGGAKRTEETEEIGKDIVRKCKGLPLAIKVMASLLRGIDGARKWRNIQKHEIWEAEKHSDARKPQILPALSLSYNHLPAHLKRCFAYTCIYPKAYVFHKMDLIKVWKAASFILPRGQYSIEDIGEEYFDELLRRSFFQLSKVDNQETFRMHDLLHNLAQSVSGPYCYQIRDNDPCNFYEKARHISLLCSAAEQPIMGIMEKSRKLRTLLSPSDHQKNFGQALDSIFQSLKYIRILDLSSSIMLELPESVGELKLLHYLDLSKTEIRRLPNSVCNLINLETLKLLSCLWLFELPKDLGKLTNLQHLELDDIFWYKLRTLPPGIGSITGLQNLHAFPVSREAGKGINELKGMLHLKGALHIKELENAANAGEANLKDKEDLVKVVFEWSNNRNGSPENAELDENIIEDLQPHPDIKEIQVIHYQGARFPAWIRDGQVKNLTSLTLNHCINCRVLSLGQLSRLQSLSLKGNLELEEWIDAPYHFLHRLNISNCPKLRDTPKIFLNLGAMKIKKCNSLKALPLIPSVMFLKLMHNLVLEDFNEHTVILGSVNNHGQPVHVRQPSFIKLLELKVIDCPKLPCLPEVFAPQKLEVSGCPLLTKLPTPEFSQRLQHLAIDACDDPTLVRAIPDTGSLYSLVISNISNLTSFPKWPHLSGLKTLYISRCNDLTSLSDETAASVPFEGMTSLELLSVRGCPNLVRFPDKELPATLKCLIISSNSGLMSLGPEEAFQNLTSLTDVNIENCPELHSLPAEGFSASLRHLLIEGCPELIKECQNVSGADSPKIQGIPDLEIEPLQVLASQNPHNPPAAWYHCLICCKGTRTIEDQA